MDKTTAVHELESAPTEFVIERGVPMPGMHKYPFADMRVGDSFALPHQAAKAVRTAAAAYGKRHARLFSVRKHEGNYRCWRLA